MSRRRHRRTPGAWDALTARYEGAAARALELEQQLTAERAQRAACDALMGDLVSRCQDAEGQLVVERERGLRMRELVTSLRQRLAGPRPTLPREETGEMRMPAVARLGSPEWFRATVGDLPGRAS